MKAPLLALAALLSFAAPAAAGDDVPSELISIIYENQTSLEACLAAMGSGNLGVGAETDGTLEGTVLTVNGTDISPLQPTCLVIPAA